MDRNMELVPDKRKSLVRERVLTFQYYGWSKRISEKRGEKKKEDSSQGLSNVCLSVHTYWISGSLWKTVAH